ncbi:MAG: hypothetical protein QM739_07695 [Propionivibrio sp.]
MQQIVSAVPGRLRIKDARFCDARIAADFVQCLQQAAANDGAFSTRINSGAESVVVQYDASRIEPREARARVEAALSEIAGRPAHRKGRSRRMRVNRYAKIGALTSLAASMAFAAAGHKRLHVITGMAFLAFLSAHLLVFRRTLVR